MMKNNKLTRTILGLLSVLLAIGLLEGTLDYAANVSLFHGLTDYGSTSVARTTETVVSATSFANVSKWAIVNSISNSSFVQGLADFGGSTKTVVAATAPTSNVSTEEEWAEDSSITNDSSFVPRLYEKPSNVTMKGKAFNPYWLLVSEVNHFAMTFVPKVMCTSIRTSLNHANCDQSGNRRTRSCAEARKNPPLRKLPLENFTTAIMIRDPFERAYSAYTNARTNRFIFIGRCGRNRTVDDCTFEEWVDELMVNPTKSFRNEHFLPQFNIAQFDRMHYHYRLRMSSSLDRNFFWNTLVGLKELVANDSSSKQHNTTNTTDPSMDTTTTTPISPIQRKFESIPNRTIDQLATLYAVDLHLWKHFLDEGTPREPDEETMFDYYLKTRKRLPKLPPKPKPKPKNQPKSPQQQQEKQQQPQQKKPPKKKKQPEEQKNQPQKPPTLKQRQPQQLREHMMERQREQDGAKNQTVRISMQPINGTEEEK